VPLVAAIADGKSRAVKLLQLLGDASLRGAIADLVAIFAFC
jgi:hypothetical protein